MKTKNVGSFEVTSGKICITDPCYTRDVHCANFGIKAKNGRWICEGDVDPDANRCFGSKFKNHRPSKIRAYHESYVPQQVIQVEVLDTGVDSGQAGIFDDGRYPENPTGQSDDKPYGDRDNPENFYERCGAVTLGKEEWRFGQEDKTPADWVAFGALEEGLVGGSLHGDGGFPTSVDLDSDGNAIRVEIDFDPQGDDDEDEDEEDEVDDDYNDDDDTIVDDEDEEDE